LDALQRELAGSTPAVTDTFDGDVGYGDEDDEWTSSRR
jgi:hypothetical protein